MGEFELRVQIWDLAGGPEYLEVRNEIYKACNARSPPRARSRCALRTAP